MQGLRREANRISTAMTWALCMVGDLPTTWFPTPGGNALDPLVAIFRDFQSDETKAFTTSSVEVDRWRCNHLRRKQS
jgi:hypothetical protein